MATVRIRAGNVQPVWAGHPWVYAQAIESIDGAPASGDVVEVVDPTGKFLGRGFFSPSSAIPVRILSRHPEEPIDAAWIGRQLDRAAEWRASRLGLPSEDTTGYRLVHAEGDGLPGLIVDVFGDVASVQLLTAGMKAREEEVFGEIARVTRCKTLIRIGTEAHRHEGFETETQIVRGPDVERLAFRERGLSFEADALGAQKTGFYFDQRDNRARVETLTRGASVLDAFCYTGGFSLAAARGGAERVVAIDSSAAAIAIGAENAHRNKLHVDFVRADVKRALAEFSQKNERFEIVILDPPKLVPSAKHLEPGRRAYRALNAAGLRVVQKGGLLVTCSCSAAMRPSDFLRTLSLAARDANRETFVLYEGRQGADHPIPAAFPEGAYLKCVVLRVL